MKFTPRLTALAAVIALSTSSASVFAAGFQLNEHSANGLGRAFAGEAATVENAAVLSRNPAAMSRFDKTSVSAQISYINPEIDLSGTTTKKVSDLYTAYNMQAAPAAEGAFSTTLGRVQESEYSAAASDVAPEAFVPSFYLISPINDKVHAGLAVFSNFGLSTDYPSDFNALEYGDKTELTTVNINPNISYQLNEQLSLGFGINLVYGDATLSTKTPNYFNEDAQTISAYNALAVQSGGLLTALPAVPGGANIANVAGDGFAWGWNIGALWTPIQGTDIAVAYRSAIDIELEGEMSSDLQPGFPRKGSLELNLPALAELSLNQKINDKLSLQASINYAGWSSFEKLEIEFDSGGSLELKEENFENVWRGSLGATYLLESNLTLRAGLAFDESPVKDEYRTISIPDTDRKWLTFGGSYKVDAGSSVDFGFAYLTGSKVGVNEEFSVHVDHDGNANTPEVSLIETELEAELSKVDTYIFSVQYNLSF